MYDPCCDLLLLMLLEATFQNVSHGVSTVYFKYNMKTTVFWLMLMWPVIIINHRQYPSFSDNLIHNFNFRELLQPVCCCHKYLFVSKIKEKWTLSNKIINTSLCFLCWFSSSIYEETILYQIIIICLLQYSSYRFEAT